MTPKRPLTTAELRHLLVHAHPGRDRLICALSSLLGLREIEISRLRWSDVTRDPSGNPIALKLHGKGRKRKDDAILVPAQLRPLLPKGRSGPIAPSYSRRSLGHPLSTRGIRWVISITLRRAGLHSPNITPHSLRHTAATIAINAGASLHDVARMLRHKDVATTLTYVHTLGLTIGSTEQLVANSIYPTHSDLQP